MMMTVGAGRRDANFRTCDGLDAMSFRAGLVTAYCSCELRSHLGVSGLLFSWLHVSSVIIKWMECAQVFYISEDNSRADANLGGTGLVSRSLPQKRNHSSFKPLRALKQVTSNLNMFLLLFFSPFLVQCATFNSSD